MATSVFMPFHDVVISHPENITVAWKPQRLRFDTRVLARDGEAPPVILDDFDLRWLGDWLKDGWQIHVGNPIRDLMERGAILLNLGGNASLGGGGWGLGRRVCGAISGRFYPFNHNTASPFYVLTTYASAGAQSAYAIPNNYRYGALSGVGGGGGGGNGNGSSLGASGGGGGGCGLKSVLLRPSGNGTFTFTIGAAGTGGVNGGAVAANGGDTTIIGTPLSSTLTAGGGVAGGRGDAATGGAGGTASNFDSNNSGGAGGNAAVDGTGGGGGAGGSAGAGGAGGNATAAGSAGTTNGGGGGAGGETSGNAGAGGGGSGKGGGYVYNTSPFNAAGGAPGQSGGINPPSAQGTNVPASTGTGQAGGAGGGGGGGGRSTNNGGAGGVGAGLILIAA